MTKRQRRIRNKTLAFTAVAALKEPELGEKAV